MKNAIKEYLNLSNDEKRQLWANAVFVFDTNIFLNLYRYTEVTRESLLKAMEQLSDRIWMPKQVAQELMKDRAKVIFDTLEIVKALKEEKEKFINNCREKLRRETSDTKIENMSIEIDEHINSLIEESSYIESVDDDKILEQLLKLYENKVGDGFSNTEIEAIKKEGTERYDKQIPPGYKDYKKGEDNNAFGDLIIWKEILSFAKNNKKDIIYVTGDKKDDWWNKVNGRTLGPRVELKKEFFDETNKCFHMYSMDRFLEQFEEIQGTQIKQSAIDEVKNYERVIEEKHRHIMRREAHYREVKSLGAEIHHLQSLLRELEEKKVYLEKRICEIKQGFDSRDESERESVAELENFSRLLDELKGSQAYLDDIMQRKYDIQREIERLELRRNRIHNSHERRVNTNDKL